MAVAPVVYSVDLAPAECHARLVQEGNSLRNASATLPLYVLLYLRRFPDGGIFDNAGSADSGAELGPATMQRIALLLAAPDQDSRAYIIRDGSQAMHTCSHKNPRHHHLGPGQANTLAPSMDDGLCECSG